MSKLIEALMAALVAIFAKPLAPRVPTQPNRVNDIDHIKKWEQLRLEAYMPTKNDVWTIGWGHTKTAKMGMKITESEAEELLRWDLEWVEETLNDVIKVPVSQKQYDALASLVFNIGGTAFRNSTVLRRLNANDYAGAADAFLMWNKQRQGDGQLAVLKGLTRRRTDEMEMFLDGT